MQPLFSGSGVRIKIIEGMALGKAVITTSIGAEGINCSNGKNLLIGNNPKEITEKIATCVTNIDVCNYLGDQARKLIETDHNNTLIMQKLIDFCYKLI